MRFIQNGTRIQIKTLYFLLGFLVEKKDKQICQFFKNESAFSKNYNSLIFLNSNIQFQPPFATPLFLLFLKQPNSYTSTYPTYSSISLYLKLPILPQPLLHFFRKNVSFHTTTAHSCLSDKRSNRGPKRLWWECTES